MSSHEETVARLEREVGEALARLDVEALRRFFADDFIGINPMSVEMTKADGSRSLARTTTSQNRL